MSLKRFLIHSNNIDRDSYIWNMTGSMLNAFQSVIMLMVLTRAVNLYEAGLFTIAYANANLFLNIGKYGVRNFQVSDTNHQFSFREYNRSRYITTSIMLIVSIGYVAIAAHANNYPAEKSQIIIWMCLFKVIDSLEDVYHGLYQQNNRLDIAGKCMTLRMLFTIIVFAVCLMIWKRLLPALIVSTIFTTIVYILFTILTCGEFKQYYGDVNAANIIRQFRLCFPLFLGTFLAFYIGNAPKYAIDSILNDEMQACYGFIAMPVFVIGLLNNFIFNPIISKMSLMWNDGEIKPFLKLFAKQLLIVLGIAIICEAGAYVLGIPVLSWLYNTDLTPYKTELLVLLLGGGFFALSGLLVTIITILRMQKVLAIGYSIVALIALFLSNIMVEKYAIMGASVLYLVLMVLLCVLFAIPLWGKICKVRKASK